ncbi:Sec61beta family protein [Candidatus Tiddalikarchaeum anstoanum]|nr:Sec61beta family protein [Candidatus Tiddalikarchaeum anstoanum]
MKNNKLPASAGGIVQYYDEATSKVNISPKQLVFVSIFFVILILILKWTNLFGL